jgi:hypothetical protein
MGILIPGENEKHEEPESESFDWLRCVIAVVTGGVGMGLGMVLGWLGGVGLDEALGYPMGKSDGFLRIGFLSRASVVLATPLGAVLGALGGHAMMSGRGSFWVGLGALLVGLVPVLLVSLSVRGLVLPLLLLVPVAVAVGLEISHVARVGGSSDAPGE